MDERVLGVGLNTAPNGDLEVWCPKTRMNGRTSGIGLVDRLFMWVVGVSMVKKRVPAGWPNGRGFTLIELIVVIVIVGILAVVAIPRFADRSAFNAAGFYEQTRAALRLAQKSAVAQRHNVCVSIAGSVLTLTQATAAGAATTCTVALVNPSTGQAYSTAAPSGVTLAATASPFSFDALGQLNLATSVTVTIAVTGDATLTRTITVEKVTGYVH